MNGDAGQPIVQRRLRRPGMGRAGRVVLRHAGRVTIAAIAAVALSFVAIGLVFLRGPIAPEGLSARVEQALTDGIGQGWSVAVGDTRIAWAAAGPALEADGVELRNPQGMVVARAPRAIVDVDLWGLATARVRPREVNFTGVDLRLAVLPDGQLALGQPGAASVPPGPASAPAAAVLADAGSVSTDATTSPSERMRAATSAVAALVGSEGLFGSLARARLSEARLILIEPGKPERVALSRVDLAFERIAPGEQHLSLTVASPAGPWRVDGVMRSTEGTARRLRISLDGVALSDMLLLSGLSEAGIGSDSAISGQVEADIVGNRVSGLAVQMALRPGRILLDGLDLPPIAIERGQVEARWQPDADRIDITRLDFGAAGIRAELSGAVTSLAGEQAALSLRADDISLTPLDPAAQPVVLPGFRLDATLTPGTRSTIRAALGTSASGVVSTIVIEQRPDGTALKVQTSGRDLDVRAALRLWPSSIAAPVREYLVDALRSGRARDVAIAMDMTPDDLRRSWQGQAIRDEAMRMTFDLANVAFAPGPGLPVLSDATVQGLVTGHTTTVKVPSARVPASTGGSLGLQEGVFTVPDMTRNDPLARLTFRLDGPVEALMGLLASEGVRKASQIDVDPSGIRGQADMKLQLGLVLGKAVNMVGEQTTMTGRLTGLTVDNVFGAEKLEQGNLALQFERGNLSLKGDGRLLGLPATVEVRQGPRGGEAQVALILDDATRARRGINLGPQFSGPLPVRVTVPITRTGKGRPRLEVDLTRLAIDEIVPGWSKPAGRPGRLSFALGEKAGATLLEDIAMEASGMTARGRAEIAADGSLNSLDLDSVKFSPGDDMRVRLEKSGGVQKVTVRGAVIDARPFIKSVLGEGAATPAARPVPAARRGTRATPAAPREAGKEATPPDLDVDLMVPILAGFNDEALTQAELRLSRRGRDIRTMRLSGRIGSEPMVAEIVRRERQPAVLTVQTGDAGGFLRYLDLYRRMGGGELVMSFTPFEARQRGEVQVRDFTLRNEPALGRILAEQPGNGAGGNDRTGNAPPAVDVREVAFTKMRADFTRTGGRYDIREAVIWGPQVGLSITGLVDYARDRVDLTGTYVPAFGLNNIFSQVPLVGRLLGGGRYEGLFAVSFRIGGSTTQPSLSVSPLSAVAPGILRQFFSFGGPGGDLPPGTVPNVGRSER